MGVLKRSRIASSLLATLPIAALAPHAQAGPQGCSGTMRNLIVYASPACNQATTDPEPVVRRSIREGRSSGALLTVLALLGSLEHAQWIEGNGHSIAP